jgi:hypothetical protein
MAVLHGAIPGQSTENGKYLKEVLVRFSSHLMYEKEQLSVNGARLSCRLVSSSLPRSNQLSPFPPSPLSNPP